MKTLLGLLFLVLGICLGVYVGGYLMFIGGIIQLIQSVTPVVVASGIAFGVAKVFFSGFVGWGITMILCGLGTIILES